MATKKNLVELKNELKIEISELKSEIITLRHDFNDFKPRFKKSEILVWIAV